MEMSGQIHAHATLPEFALKTLKMEGAFLLEM
jgi:hypothetical protein